MTCQAQSTPKTIGILTTVFCTPDPNLVALAWTDDELSRGEAQNGVNFNFEGKFDLEGKSKGKSQSNKQNYRDLNQGLLHLWFQFDDPSLNGSRVITRTSKWLTHGRTDRRRQRQYPMAILPSGKNISHLIKQGIQCYRNKEKQFFKSVLTWFHIKLDLVRKPCGEFHWNVHSIYKIRERDTRGPFY